MVIHYLSVKAAPLWGALKPGVIDAVMIRVKKVKKGDKKTDRIDWQSILLQPRIRYR